MSTPPPPIAIDSLVIAIQFLFKRVDINTISVKGFMKELSAKHFYGISLSPCKSLIIKELTKLMAPDTDNNSASSSSSSSSSSSLSSFSPPLSSLSSHANTTTNPLLFSPSKTESTQIIKPQPKKPNPFHAPLQLSPALSTFLQTGSSLLSRCAVVKLLWEYIRKHNLQDPKNRRDVLLDSEMFKVFGVWGFSIFGMNSFLAQHLWNVDADGNRIVKEAKEKKTPRTREEKIQKQKDTVARKREKAIIKQRKQQEIAEKRGVKHNMYRLSPQLAKVCGSSIIRQYTLLKRLKSYIKVNGLQDHLGARKHVVRCDGNLKDVFDAEEVSALCLVELCKGHVFEIDEFGKVL